MVPDGTQWYHMVLNDAKWYPMVPNGYQWYQMLPNGNQWYQIVPNGTKLYLMLPKGTIHLMFLFQLTWQLLCETKQTQSSKPKHFLHGLETYASSSTSYLLISVEQGEQESTQNQT